MTREEFESILEEAYIEGYNSALEDIQEDILDEEAYDLEGEYNYYTETMTDRQKAELAYNYRNLKRQEGESEKDFKQRKSNWLRYGVATRSAATNGKLANTMGNLARKRAERTGEDEENTEMGKQSIKHFNNLQRSVGAESRYGKKVRDDADKFAERAIRRKMVHDNKWKE